MFEDFDRCLRAAQARDARFDGWFFLGVRSTGIYCRPSCPATPPKPENLTFHPTAAAAQRAGFRACKRCRPDATPGSPVWDHRTDVVARAMRLIADGVVDRVGVPGLAAQLGYSVRQLQRHLRDEVGTGPVALARAQRAQTARLLVETTDLPLTEVAFAAGFGSVRSFNDVMREVFATSPRELRAQARREPFIRDRGRLHVRLPFRTPWHPDNLFGHLVATAVPGVEEWRDGAYRRTLDLPHGAGIVALRPADDHVACALRLDDFRDLTAAIARCRRLLDLDADPVAVGEALAADPALRKLVGAAPGRRVPRTVDAGELALRAVLGQQVSTAAAATHAGRLAAAIGAPVDDPDGGLTRQFPTAAAVARVSDEALRLPRGRVRALRSLARALADGDVDLGSGADRATARADLLALPGIGPWTAEVIAMRGLGDPDAMLPTDLGVRAAAERLGLPATPAALLRHAQAWRPWRSYAVQYLWASGDHAVNRMPATTTAA